MRKKTDKLTNINREIENVNQELKEIERRKKHILQMEKNKKKREERKARAKRLIETGALAEKYFEIHSLSIKEREELFKMFSTFIKSNKPNKFKK